MKFPYLLKFITISVVILGVYGCMVPGSEYLKIGNAAYSQENYQEALINYRIAQIEAPDDPLAYNNAGTALYRMGEYPQAAVQFQFALQLSQEDEIRRDIFFNLGNSLYQNGDFVGAVNAFIQSLLIEPSNLDSKTNLELSLLQIGDKIDPPAEDDVQEETETTQTSSQSSDTEYSMSQKEIQDLLENLRIEIRNYRDIIHETQYSDGLPPKKDW